MKISFPTYLNQVWNFFADDTGKIQVVAGEISENAPTSYDTAICTLNECPESEERAKLIANAPDMFRVLCNIGGEVNNGTASLPDFIMEDIDNILHNITRQRTAQDETE